MKFILALCAICARLIWPCTGADHVVIAFTLNEATVTLSETHDIALSVSYNNIEVLTGVLGKSLPLAVNQPTDCSDGTDVCLQWGDLAKLTVRERSACYNVRWSSVFSHLEDCFDFSAAHWYGGGETYNQSWPFGDTVINAAAVTTGDTMTTTSVFGSLMDPYWVSSNGVLIFVSSYETGVPLFIRYNVLGRKEMCFKSTNEYPYYQYSPTSDNPLVLHYEICTEANIRDAHHLGLRRHLHHPVSTVDLSTLQYPIWSTWAYYKADITQNTVTDFAKSILDYGFNISQFEIDDLWESCYGEAEFADSWDPTTLISDLHNLGLRVTFWTHPFVNFECSSFQTGITNGYFVQDVKDRSLFTSWWDGAMAGLIDFTNDDAVDWWKGRLSNLMTNYGVDGFKFDAGEAGYLPYCSYLKTSADVQPNAFCTAYATAISQNFGDFSEMRTGYRAQKLPLLFRILDRDSTWESENGLKSVIPTTLIFGLLGYPFVLPDMVGGNAYGDMPTKELFIRWLEVNVFLPSIQLSIPPWYYDNDTVEAAKNLLALRDTHSARLIAAANQTVDDGTPIVRPLWWLRPFDEETYVIDSEFMLGDDLLVAPILDENSETRDIYLPYGYWQDQLDTSREPITGPTWLRSYSADLYQLPHFILVSYTTPQPTEGSTVTAPTTISKVVPTSASAHTSAAVTEPTVPTTPSSSPKISITCGVLLLIIIVVLV